MENFLQAKFKDIILRESISESSENCSSQLEVKAQLYEFFETEEVQLLHCCCLSLCDPVDTRHARLPILYQKAVHQMTYY